MIFSHFFFPKKDNLSDFLFFFLGNKLSKWVCSQWEQNSSLKRDASSHPKELIRGFSDFKAFLYILIGGFSQSKFIKRL